MNTHNSKTNESNRFRYYFIDKLSLKNNKTIALANYFTWQMLNLNTATTNLKFLPQLGWNETFDMSDGSHAITDIQDYFEFITRNMRQLQMKILP